MAIIKIKNLKLKAIIGVEEHERNIRQDIIINVQLEFDAQKAVESDNLFDTIDYKALKQNIISLVEASSFFLVEKLAGEILKICLDNSLVTSATVEIDKPTALQFVDSVSVTLSGEK